MKDSITNNNNYNQAIQNILTTVTILMTRMLLLLRIQQGHINMNRGINML